MHSNILLMLKVILSSDFLNKDFKKKNYFKTINSFYSI